MMTALAFSKYTMPDSPSTMSDKSPEAYRTISEAAVELDLPQHVLRFWETRFTQIRPMKRGGGRRYYRPEDVDLLKGIRYFLYSRGFTIRGLQKIIKDQGVSYVIQQGVEAVFTPVAEKPRGPEVIVPPVDLTRTRARLDRQEELSIIEENSMLMPLKQSGFARNLIENLTNSFDLQNSPSPLMSNIKMSNQTDLTKQPFSFKSTFNPAPVSIPEGQAAVSNGRGLTQPITQNPSPLVKFHPIEDEIPEIPAFIQQRDLIKREALPSERYQTASVKPSNDDYKRLNAALFELNECKLMLNNLF
jgi:DNA-binding transcriptional MerR regulator